jgi:glutathione S-transferase
MKLYYHPTSSASLRVLIFLTCRGVPESKSKLVSTGIRFDKRGIPVWTIPESDKEAKVLKTNDYKELNPEGRVPLLILKDGRKMTQTGAIIEFIDNSLEEHAGTIISPESV